MASVQKNPKGFAFLIFDDSSYEDQFLPPPQARNLLNGDRVAIEIRKGGQATKVEVRERRLQTFFGVISEGGVLYQARKSRELFPLRGEFNLPPDGTWVKAKVIPQQRGPYAFVAEIVEVLGSVFPASRDVEMLAAEMGWTEQHSERAEQEAKALKLDLNNLGNRKDIRALPLITIDGETARDFDDAVWVEPTQQGYRLVVAIADVSHYVKRGTAIDAEAEDRATSVYFPERAFHMLPRALSENLCSLIPNQPRFCMVADMRYDSTGKRTSCEVYDGLMQSKRRATYNEIQKEFESARKQKGGKPWEFASHFELYELIRAQKTHRGSIDFDLPESEIRVDAEGEPTAIELRTRLESHRLIEEFMIAANEAVTEWMLERKLDFLFRVHEQPDPESLKRFQKLAATMGVNLALSHHPQPKELAGVVRKIAGHPAEFLLNSSMLRSMKQAHYTAAHDIHFGLASSAYTHFTSPIRRYPDLVVHRLLKAAIAKKREYDAQQIEKICVHCSQRERQATDTEREAIKLKQARYMHRHLGEIFEGRISGMNEKGLYIQIRSPHVEGFLPQEGLGGDRYEFNDERMTYHNKRTNVLLRVGETIHVQVVRANIERRQIEFIQSSGQILPN